MSEASIVGKAAPVRFENVTKRFGRDVVAVDNINLSVKAGKLVTLLGPSGCGENNNSADDCRFRNGIVWDDNDRGSGRY